MSSVAERIAKAQGEPVPAPKRLIIMFTHYGCLTDSWFPVNSHGELDASDFTGTSLEALAPHAGKILLPRGMRAMNEWTSDVSLGQGNDPLLQTVGSYFTCAPVTPHTDDPFDLDNTAAKFEAMPVAASLDHVCAQQLSSGGLPLLMRVGGTNDTPQHAISYSGPEQLFLGVDTHADALAAVGISLGGEPQDTYETVRRQSIVDLVKDDLETLEGFDMSASDKQKLAAWKELLYATSGGIARCEPELPSSLGLTEANLGIPVDPEADALTSKVTDSLDRADLFANLAVLSALCDPGRVVVLKYPGNYVFRGLGLSVENRSLAARIVNGTGQCVANINDLLMTVDRYYAEKFAHLVRQLDDFAEGDGSVLDNSAAVWFQQWSDGAAMNMNNIPIVQAGSCGGYFKTGCAVNVDGGAADLTRGNSSGACDPERPPSSKGSGTPVELANAPINKYYCNLMNAIGVKAGADGFPAVGGTEKVTHYGMYDDTRDFASGGANPPTINSPGEFEQLRG